MIIKNIKPNGFKHDMTIPSFLKSIDSKNCTNFLFMGKWTIFTICKSQYYNKFAVKNIKSMGKAKGIDIRSFCLGDVSFITDDKEWQITYDEGSDSIINDLSQLLNKGVTMHDLIAVLYPMLKTLNKGMIINPLNKHLSIRTIENCKHAIQMVNNAHCSIYNPTGNIFIVISPVLRHENKHNVAA